MSTYAIFDSIARLLSRLPPEGYAVLAKLINTLLTSSDPLEATKRAAIAAASAQASEEALKRALGRRR